MQRGLVGEILARFERKGLQIVAMKFITATTAQASQHYQEHREKPFFAGLVAFITSSPMVTLVLEGDEAITNHPHPDRLDQSGRKWYGDTSTDDYGISKSNNLVHGSDSPESAVRELAIWFPEAMTSWTSCAAAWIQGD